MSRKRKFHGIGKTEKIGNVQKCVHLYIYQQNGEACFRKTLSQNGDPQDIAVAK